MQQAILMLDRIVSKSLDPLIVLEVFLIQLGWTLALGIPMAILSATLMTFGRMSGDNEITAIKASGRSMAALMVPVLAAAAVITVALCFFHDLILPEANHRSANLLRDISLKRPAAFIEPGVLIRDFQDYVLYVEDVNAFTGDLGGIRIFSNVPNDDPMVTIAERGHIRMTGDGEYLVLSLSSGETHSTSRDDDKDYLLVRFEEQTLFIKNIDTQFERSEGGNRSDREMNIATLMSGVHGFRESNALMEEERVWLLDSIAAVSARLESLAISPPEAAEAEIEAASEVQQQGQRRGRRDRNGSPEASMRRLQNQLRQYEGRITRIEENTKNNNFLIAQYLVEVHKKFAIPIACLIFVLIGAPLGIMARRGGLAVGASYSVFFFVMYWAFLITGENWGDKMIVSPAVGMWSGNVFLAICGTVLMMLMLRETSINFGFLKNIFGKGVPLFKRMSDIWIFRLPGMLFSIPRVILNRICGRLPTYLIGSFWAYTIGLLAALVVIFVTIDYVSNLRRFEQATHFQVVLFYYYYLPWIAQTVLPIVLFLASMFSMGRLAKLSELTAMKAAGVNVRQLTMSLLLFGLLLSGGVFFGGEKVIPHANEKRMLLRSNFGKQDESEVAQTIREYRRDFYYFARPDIMYVFNEFCTEPQFFRGVRRYKFTASGITELIDASEAEFDSTGWRFVNGYTRSFSEEGMSAENFSVLPDSVLTSVPLDLVKRVRSKESMSYWELASHIEAAKRRGEKVDRFMAELQFKIAFPFMNFIVILFGLSLAARTGRRGGAALFGVGLMLSFLFWILSRFLLVFAQNGLLPTLAGAWLANIIFLVLGLALYRKAAH
jgi:lipopolysaccharide export system permease protein